jgi:hypothetical protein
VMRWQPSQAFWLLSAQFRPFFPRATEVHPRRLG